MCHNSGLNLEKKNSNLEYKQLVKMVNKIWIAFQSYIAVGWKLCIAG